MNGFDLAMRLIVDGFVVVPDVCSPDEVTAMSEGFERRAGELGKRSMNFDEIHDVPGLMAAICHPNLMAVVEPFMRHFGYDAAFACCSGIRDVFTPGQENARRPFDPSDLRHAPVGWHDDVPGCTDPRASVMATCLTSLIYLDETFADNGAYLAARGSHHLACADADDKPRMAPAEVALDHCELVACPVKPGSAVIHRAHNWHGVMPFRQRRRLFLQTFTSTVQYDQQVGHSQLNETSLSLVPADRHRFIRHYASSRA